MRTALLPGVSAHGSAHALAQFYAALGAGKVVPPALLAQAQQLAVNGQGASGEAVRFGLGFQLGTCADAGPLQRVHVESGLLNNAVGFVNASVTGAKKVMDLPANVSAKLAGGGEKDGERGKKAVLGHAGVGGSIGLCVPEKGVALAVTVSRLSGQRIATKRLVELMLGEGGLGGLAGL